MAGYEKQFMAVDRYGVPYTTLYDKYSSFPTIDELHNI